MGHTTQTCKEDVQWSEPNPREPAYSPWLVGMRPKQWTTKEPQEGNGGHRTPGAKPREKKTWYGIMSEARTDERKAKPNHQGEDNARAEGQQRAGEGNRNDGDKMDVEREGDRDTTWDSTPRDTLINDTDLDLNETPGETTMILHTHIYPQTHLQLTTAKPASQHNTHQPIQTRKPPPKPINLIANHPRDTYRPQPIPHIPTLHRTTQSPTKTAIQAPTKANKLKPH